MRMRGAAFAGCNLPRLCGRYGKRAVNVARRVVGGIEMVPDTAQKE
jgi:hypothetical protein